MTPKLTMTRMMIVRAMLLVLQEEPLVMDVPLPSIDLAHVVLHTDDHVDEADAEASGSDAAMWKLLEQRIMPGQRPRLSVHYSGATA